MDCLREAVHSEAGAVPAPGAAGRDEVELPLAGWPRWIFARTRSHTEVPPRDMQLIQPRNGISASLPGFWHHFIYPTGLLNRKLRERVKFRDDIVILKH